MTADRQGGSSSPFISKFANHLLHLIRHSNEKYQKAKQYLKQQDGIPG